MLSIRLRSTTLHLLLSLDLAVVLDVDVLVGGESVDLVFREGGTGTLVRLRSTHLCRLDGWVG